MSIEMSDLEEGEVVDSDCDASVDKLSTSVDSKDSGGTRPITDNAVAGFGSKTYSQSVAFSSLSSSMPAAPLSYRTHRSKTVSNSEDSCDSSDEDSVLWNQKRAKYISKHPRHDMDTNPDSTLPLFRNPLTCQNGNEKRQKKSGNNIWGSVLEEQCLTQDMKSFDVENSIKKRIGDRNVESYDFTKAAGDTRPYLDSDEDNMDGNPDADDPFGGEVVDLEPNEGAGAIIPRKRKHVKKRLGERTYDKKKSRAHVGVTKDDSEAKIVAALVEHLHEPKVQLLSRVVNVLGKEKTLELLYMTEDIEASGGMMTMDGSRRRTKGGVFIQLIKTDKHIEQKDVKEIFAEEMKEQKKILKALYKKRRRQRLHGKNVHTHHSTIMQVDKDNEVSNKGKHDGRGDGMDSSHSMRCDENRSNNNSRNVVCYDSDENSDDSVPLNTTTGSNDLSNDGEVCRESGDGASDSGSVVKTGSGAANTNNVLDEHVYDEDMLDIMPGEGETIE